MAKAEEKTRVTLKGRVAVLEELVKKLISRADNTDQKIIAVSKDCAQADDSLNTRVRNLETEIT